MLSTNACPSCSLRLPGGRRCWAMAADLQGETWCVTGLSVIWFDWLRLSVRWFDWLRLSVMWFDWPRMSVSLFDWSVSIYTLTLTLIPTFTYSHTYPHTHSLTYNDRMPPSAVSDSVPPLCRGAGWRGRTATESLSVGAYSTPTSRYRCTQIETYTYRNTYIYMYI